MKHLLFLTIFLMASNCYAENRTYLCPIVGNGTEGNAYRPVIAEYRVNWVADIPSNKDGTPINQYAVVVVSADDHSQLLKDSRIKEITKSSGIDFAISKGIVASEKSTSLDAKDTIAKQLNLEYKEGSLWVK